MKSFFTLLIFPLLLISCGNDDQLDELVIVDYDTPFTLRVGQTAITTDSTMVTLIHIPTDSRCALNVVCVWEGEIIAQLEGAQGGIIVPIELQQSLGQINPATASFIRFQVELIEANPYPDLKDKNGGDIELGDYELTLVLSVQQ